MASYKVPQDVEAEDKLLGPFSFRQFIYLIVAAIAGFLMWALGQVFVGLAVIPLPILAFFLILALPLRKDQPMETYLLAMVQFFLKPRIRYWTPEGNISLVQIMAPRVIEQQLTKGITGDQASQQLAYLAQVIDTGGWAARGVNSANQSMTDIVMAEAQQAEDVLDESSDVGQSFDRLITSSDTSRKQAMIDQLQQSIDQPKSSDTNQIPAQTAPISTIQSAAAATPPPPATPPSNSSAPAQPVRFDPYPSSMRQRVIHPVADEPAAKPVAVPKAIQPTTTSIPPNPSLEQPSPDIIRLANNNDLSISAIAREAHRLADKQDGEEVVISLR